MAIMAGDDILKGKKILVVDDERDILETLEELLDNCVIETARYTMRPSWTSWASRDLICCRLPLIEKFRH